MKDSFHSQSVPNILVVDDTLESLVLISSILKRHAYKVRTALSGPLALDAAKILPPDLILLDINMPEMNGFEVCQHLKADPALADIPVIFLSALSDVETKVSGLRGGGNDYITKPFHIDEVLARIDIHLALCNPRRALNAPDELLEKKLTPREGEVLHWVREGKRNQEIATILAISSLTVRNHLAKIFEKLGVETRTAAAKAFEPTSH